MHVSSRWCVTALLALGALGCSDPVAPPAQGAFVASVRTPSPRPDGTMCAGLPFTYDVPAVIERNPVEQLDQDTYKHKAVDGENGAAVSCSVKGGSTFTFSGDISAGVKALRIEGSLGADLKGTARVTVVNAQLLSSPLASPEANCVVNAAKGDGNNFQVKAGHIWASFDCPLVSAPPSEACSAKGFFVLENCEQ